MSHRFADNPSHFVELSPEVADANQNRGGSDSRFPAVWLHAGDEEVAWEDQGICTRPLMVAEVRDMSRGTLATHAAGLQRRRRRFCSL